ncbi:MAG: hypothetical protein IJ825_10030 [Oscillospiraceae bacterium]|nr:hypothetical protein [Oscillospiraceae bacterium]
MKHKITAFLAALCVAAAPLSLPVSASAEDLQYSTEHCVIEESFGQLVVTSLPDRTTYAIGEPLDLTGLTVSLLYGNQSDGMDTVYDSVNPLEMPETFTIQDYRYDSSFPGTYTIGVILSDNDRAEMFRLLNPEVYFEVKVTDTAYTLRGDSDNNGSFALNDLVMLQRYLLGMSAVENWMNADMNHDNVLDVFDLALMKARMFAANPTYAARELTRNLAAQPVETSSPDDAFVSSQNAFALSLMQKTAKDGENTLISPYSVMQALAMTANGAQGDTLREMEQVLAGGTPVADLNRSLAGLRGQYGKTSQLMTANSVWFRDDVQVNDGFLQNTADYYDASAFAAPFDDTTLKDINLWVRTNTDEMIPKLLDRIDPDLVMCLINAVTFDAQWEDKFDPELTWDGTFTAASGAAQTVPMMNGETYGYLSDEHSTGFIKYYQDGKYAFAAILPEEGMTTGEYLATLTPDALHTMLSNPSRETVDISLPKFSLDYSTELGDTLQAMGMTSAFQSETADFSAMSDRDLYISAVLHKTHIDMYEGGTRAAAVTAVLVKETCVMEPPKSVVLDRPFVYVIMDTQTSLPIFFGTVETLS